MELTGAATAEGHFRQYRRQFKASSVPNEKDALTLRGSKQHRPDEDKDERNKQRRVGEEATISCMRQSSP